MTLPPELEAQARELAWCRFMTASHPGFSEKCAKCCANLKLVREMAQRTLGWAAKEAETAFPDSSGLVAQWLRSLAGQEERDGK